MSRVAFWATVCKTVRHMLSGSLSVCPDLYVCNVGVFWPNGWMDQDATWYGGRSRPRPHCGRWRSTHLPPLQKRGGIFLPISVVAKRLDRSRCHLVQRYASAQATLCYMGTQRSPQRKGAQPHQFSAYAYCDQTVAHLSCC